MFQHKKSYVELEKLGSNVKYKDTFRNRIKKFLDKGLDIPDWFSYAEVTSELKESRLPFA